MTDPTAPQLIGTYGEDLHFADIATSGTFAYLLDDDTFLGPSKLIILDCSDPTLPKFAGSLDQEDGVTYLGVRNPYVYLSPALRAVDVSNPALPVIQGETHDAPTGGAMTISGSRAYVLQTYSTPNFNIFDLSNPSMPLPLGGYQDGDFYSILNSIAVSGPFAYIGDSDLPTNFIDVLDVSDPQSVTLKSQFTIASGARDMAISGSLLFVVGSDKPVISVIDISDPAFLFTRAVYSPMQAGGIAVNGNLAYVGDYKGGLTILQYDGGSLPTPTPTSSPTPTLQTPTPSPSPTPTYPPTPTPAGKKLEMLGWTGGTVRTVDLGAEHAYVVEGPGITIMDTSDPTSPHVVGRSRVGSQGKLGIKEPYVYVPRYFSGGALIIDATDPSAPFFRGYSASSVDSTKELRATDLPYLMSRGLYEIQTIDISVPDLPIGLATYSSGPFSDPNRVAVSGHYAYVAYSDGLRIFDIQNGGLALVGTALTPFKLTDVAVSGSFAFVAEDTQGLVAFDVSDPTKPTIIAQGLFTAQVLSVSALGTRVLMELNNFGPAILDFSDPQNPAIIGGAIENFAAVDVALTSDRAWAAHNENGLSIYDISDPTSFKLQYDYTPPYSSFGMAVSGSIACLADGPKGFAIVDVSNPRLPIPLSTYATQGTCYHAAISGSVAYLAQNNGGLHPFDISTPSAPKPLPTPAGLYSATDMVVSNSMGYVGTYTQGLAILDLTSPSNPVLIGTHPLQSTPTSLTLVGSLLYVTTYAGLEIVDLFHPAEPVSLGTFDSAHSAYSVAVSGSVAVLAEGEVNGIEILNVSEPTTPTLIGAKDRLDALGVALSGSDLYLANGYGGLGLFDISNPAAPVLTGYYDLEGYANQVLLSGPLIYVADTYVGLSILNRSGVVIPTPSPTPTPVPVEDAVPVSNDVPSTIARDNTVPVQITVRNTGNTQWRRELGYALEVSEDTCNLIADKPLLIDPGAMVNPGGEYTFRTNLLASNDGPCTIGLQMAKSATPFGTSFNIALNVIDPLQDATFVSTTIPARLPLGASIGVGVTYHNTGNTYWSSEDNDVLAVLDDGCPLFGSGTFDLAPDSRIAPGEYYQFVMPITAPSTEGSCEVTLQMAKHYVAVFGQSFTRTVIIAPPPNAAYDWTEYQ